MLFRSVGAAKNINNFIMITLGTGVGGSYYSVKSGLIKGEHWRAAEFGHMILYPNGRECGCGQMGCVEQYISGTAMERIYREKHGEELEGTDIFKKAFNSDEKSKIVVEEFIKDTSIFLTTLTNALDPEAIIIGGGLINSKDYWLEDLKLDFQNRLNSNVYPKIIPAKLLNDAGMIGAGKIAFDNI